MTANTLSMFTFSQLVDAFASTLGREHSKEVISEAVRSLGYVTDVLTDGETLLVLAALSKSGGMIGVTARFLRTRLESGRPIGGQMSSPGIPLVTPPTEPPFRPSRVPQSTPSTSGPRIALTKLAGILTQSLGREKSTACVQDTAARLGIHHELVSKSEALAVLEVLAEEPGLVGVTAQFGKARAILLFSERASPPSGKPPD